MHPEDFRDLENEAQEMKALLRLLWNSVKAVGFTMPPLTVKQAQLLGVCRICMLPDGSKMPLVLNYGKEHAHQQCLDFGDP